MAYRHRAKVHKKQRKALRVGMVAAAAVFFLLAGAGFIILDWALNLRSDSNTVVSTESTTSVQSVNVSVYRTKYFQFQAPEEWTSVVNTEDEDTFIFLKDTDPLITQRLVVKVDRTGNERQNDNKITHVLPVSVVDNKTLLSDMLLSDHCDNSWPEDVPKNPTRITVDGVSVVCSAGSGQYNVALGVVGESDDIPFTTSTGEGITLSIVYSDLTATPGLGDLKKIIESFEVL